MAAGQIYAEAESNANLFAIAEAQQYKWPQAKYTQKPRVMQIYLQRCRRSAGECRGVSSINGRRPNIAEAENLVLGESATDLQVFGSLSQD